MSNTQNKIGAVVLSAAITIHAINHPEDGHSHSEIEPGQPLTSLVIPISGMQLPDSRIILLNDLTFTQSGVLNSSGVWVDFGSYSGCSGIA